MKCSMKNRTTIPEREWLFSRGQLRSLIVPLLLEQGLAILIGIADTVMVSGCSEAAVSGVSLVDSINVLLIQVFSALATGGAVVTAQYLGKGDRKSASDSARQLFYVVLLSSLALAGVCLPLRTPILAGLFGSIEADVMRHAQIYFLLTALSYPFLAMYNASAALLRSMNNAKASMYTSLVMNLINVAGNAVLIYGFGLEVMGAGIATLVSRMVGAALMQHTLRSPECALPYPRLLPLRWQGGLVRKILTVGIPNGLENGLFQLGKLLLVRMIATFGTVSIAANAVGNSIATIQCLPGSAFGLAMITVVGQCVGARRYDQARMYIRRLMTTAYLLMSSFNILLLLVNRFIVRPFLLSPETEALALQVILIHGLGAITIWPLSFVFPNALRAAGDARYTMIVSALSMLLFRVVLGHVLGQALGMGLIGVWLAMQADWVVRITCFLIRYRSGKWMTKALV